MKYELHFACSAWPEMPPEALHELAGDIEANGLHEPLTLTRRALATAERRERRARPAALVHGYADAVS